MPSDGTESPKNRTKKPAEQNHGRKANCGKMCCDSYCPRNIQLLKWKNGVIPTDRRTREHENLRPGWTGADKKDIGDRMHVLAEEFRGIQTQIPTSELDVAAALVWGRAQSLKISRHIKAQKAIKAAKDAVTAARNAAIGNAAI